MDDRTIIERLRQGSPDGLAAVSVVYRERLVASAARVLHDHFEAEDVAEETLLRASKAVDVRRAESLGGWLGSVCRRLAIDRLRVRRQDARAFAATTGRGPTEAADGPAERADDRRRLAAHVDRLDEPYRTAIRLRYFDGLEFIEVARRMDTIERTARTWVGRGLTRLRKLMGVKL